MGTIARLVIGRVVARSEDTRGRRIAVLLVLLGYELFDAWSDRRAGKT